MSTATASPERPAELRIALTGLRLAIGRRDGSGGYEVALEPAVARALALDLLAAAALAEQRAQPALDELSRVCEAEFKASLARREAGG